MTNLRVALDWTPNINHIGIIVALEKGWYETAGIKLSIIDPSVDQYKTTPAKKLELGEAELSIGPFESVISMNTKARPLHVQAIYAILQEDISSIAVLKNKGIESPADLDGRIYASYNARYEDAIVQQMIRNGGGKGNITISYPSKLGIWNTLLSGEADATWIFDNWEGMEAAKGGIELRGFRMADYGIPYGYSPVIFATQKLIHQHKALLKLFIRHTRAGYLYAQSHPEESKIMLDAYLPDADKAKINLSQCIIEFGHYFGNDDTAGYMKSEKVKTFLNWLVKHGLENESINSLSLYTNELFQNE